MTQPEQPQPEQAQTDQPQPDGAALTGRLAMIGAGNMGRTILAGLLAAGVAPEQLAASTRSQASAERLAEELGIQTGTDNQAAVADADIVVLAVKPKDIVATVDSLDLAEGTVLVSVAAGISTAAIEAVAPGTHVVRVMPNTPAQQRQGMSGVSGGASASDAHVTQVVELMSAVGKAVVVPESQQDLVVAVSGSGVAYLYLVAESMISAGVTLGLTRAVAAEMVVQTFAGATAMLQTGEHPAVLRENVSSPGGTTVQALAQLEAHGIRTALLDAMTAARDASAGLG